MPQASKLMIMIPAFSPIFFISSNQLCAYALFSTQIKFIDDLSSPVLDLLSNQHCLGPLGRCRPRTRISPYLRAQRCMLPRHLHNSDDLPCSQGDYHPFDLGIQAMLFRPGTLFHPRMHAMPLVRCHNSNSGSNRNSSVARHFQRLRSRPPPNGGGFISSEA